MPAEFRQTLQALEREQRSRARTLVIQGVIVLILAGWGAWFVLARVPVFVLSREARIQASAHVHPVDAFTTGRVRSVHLPVGGHVSAGDVLLELDSKEAELRLEEAQTRALGLSDQIAALEAELAARELAIAEIERVGQASLSEAAALRHESEAAALQAAREQQRTDRLYEAGVVAEAAHEQAQAAREQTQAQAAARARRISLVEAESRRALAESRAEREGLARTLAALRADLGSTRIQVSRLEDELERHTVRAPITGRLGQVQAPQVGSVVESGQTIAVITPDGALDIVADFAPSESVGKMRPGQPARMRVSGFPWTQYGTLSGKVSAISGEAHQGRIRVTLAVDDNHTSIPLGHGLTGVVEVEIERVAPVILVLRAAGHRLSGSGEHE